MTDYLEWAKNKWQLADDKNAAMVAALIAIADELRDLNDQMEVVTEQMEVATGMYKAIAAELEP
jgi:hypothetical protein